MDLDMERAVDAGGLRSPPIGGAQRSEGAGGGGGGRILKFVFEIWIQGCKSWRS
jgi:hypothetical protein